MDVPYQPPVSGLQKTEGAFDNADTVFDPRSGGGLDTVSTARDLVDPARVAIAPVGQGARPRRVFADDFGPSLVGRFTSDGGFVTVQQVGQTVRVWTLSAAATTE